jgi:hypothetical protein
MTISYLSVRGLLFLKRGEAFGAGWVDGENRVRFGELE